MGNCPVSTVLDSSSCTAVGNMAVDVTGWHSAEMTGLETGPQLGSACWYLSSLQIGIDLSHVMTL